MPSCPFSGGCRPVSNLTEIRHAHEYLRELLNQELRKRDSKAATLERYVRWLDTAFYLLAWGNFEHLTKKQAEAVIAEEERKHGRAKYAWSFVQKRMRDFSVARQIELVFHGRGEIIENLKQHYLVRNDSAHGYKRLPAEMRHLPDQISEWEKLVDRF